MQFAWFFILKDMGVKSPWEDRKENNMNRFLEMTGYYNIIEQLQEYTLCAQAKEMAAHLEPLLSERELRKQLRDTSQARKMLDCLGTPPLFRMERIEEYLEKAAIGELLLPEQIEQVGGFLISVKRLKAYLERGRDMQIGLAFYSDNLTETEELAQEIIGAVRGGRIEDGASVLLRDIRRQLQLLEEKISEKAERSLRTNKAFVSDSFVVKRNGRICIPVKKEFKSKIQGTVVDKSATGATFFIEPQVVAQLREEYELYQMEEDNEERKIVYTLMSHIVDVQPALQENIRTAAVLDYIFAKGKLSEQMQAVEPSINLERRICLQEARHPMLDRENCVPLNLTMGGTKRGVIITGPNTGGKTVAIKTVALLGAMACAGLHIPCKAADIAMNNQILCDIGDGQNMKDNLSTFSAHISNVLDILQKTSKESLIILDELGSGTDPAEGMGIAIAILEQLRRSGALFLVTTHYPEVKEYAGRHPELIKAGMAFDKETLQPLYRLETGKTGESCALYIAKRLGIPDSMLKIAAREAYGADAGEAVIEELGLGSSEASYKKERVPGIQKQECIKKEAVHGAEYVRGDSVIITPEQSIGIVVKPVDRNGNVLVQVKKEKHLINHKRLRLKVAASRLYPEDYDFSIIFDTVENRKARHQMGKKHQEGLVVETGPEMV